MMFHCRRTGDGSSGGQRASKKVLTVAPLHRGMRRLALERLEPRQLLAAELVISELMADNDAALLDEDGDSSDWIELHNRGDVAAQLSEYYLTDDSGDPTRWQLPARSLAPDAYAIVFASGKNRRSAEAPLHTNFALDANGEYLALSRRDGASVQIVQQFSPQYPRQRKDVSYGIDRATTGHRYFTKPTPGAPNNLDGPVGFVADTQFSVDRGFYHKPSAGEGPLAVEITTATPGATVVYTTDGTLPRADTSRGLVEVTSGLAYRGPLEIETTTVLRAAAFKPNLVPTNVDTQSYIFLEEVVRQSGEGRKDTWGVFPNSTSIGGTRWRIGQDVPSDWEMDQDIVNDPAYSATITKGLQAVPTISLVMDPDDLFGKDGIYVNPLRRGSSWERPVSVEYFDTRSGAEFQLSAGVRIHGGASRRPDQTRKHSLRLKFRERYDGNSQLEFPFFDGVPFGDSAVDRFDSLVLRASYSDGFSVGDLSWSPINLRDQWARDAQLAMGRPSAHGRFVHVFVNGLYWGLYNATERIDGSFVEAYLGGDKDNADVMSDDGLNEGDTRAWREALSLSRRDLSTPAAYAAVRELVDIDSLIDSMLVQIYAGNWDWPQNNWLAVRDRGPDGRFHFPVWDVEVGLGAARNASGHDLTRNRTRVRDAGTPAQLYSALQQDEGFRLQLADHIQRHFFHGGPLSPEGAAALFQARVDEGFDAMVPETARWGDHNGAGGSTRNLPYTRDGEWARELDWIRDTWFPRRTEVVLEQFREIGLYPGIDAPVFRVNGRDQHGDAVAAGDLLAMHATAGEIWYTLDGTDPRMPADTAAAEVALVTADAPVRVLVPSPTNGGDRLDNQWWGGNQPFDDSVAAGWIRGSGGVGYDRGAGRDYDDRIQTDIEPQMDGAGGSVFVRIPFTVTAGQLDTIDSLKLRIEYDDGFVAYLNGVEVSRVNFADPVPSWNSVSSRTHESFGFQEFDIGQHLSVLREGDNILAIHGLNRASDSDDMLVLAELVASEGRTAISSSATRFDAAPIVLTETTTVQARAFRDGEFSALSDATFIVSPPPEMAIAITEINYHPYDPTPDERSATPTRDKDDFEFIEVANVHPTDAVNLGQLQLNHGVRFTFPPVRLPPGGRAVVVEDVAAFWQRYGNSAIILGQWTGKLSNAGEQLTLADRSGNALLDFAYDDRAPWPQRADGAGGTLELMDPWHTPPAQYGQSNRWRGSSEQGGSPGVSAGPMPQAGDANRDRVFEQIDIILVLQAGKYATGEAAVWSEGDWNGDGVFDQLDIVEALRTQRYRQGVGRG